MKNALKDSIFYVVIVGPDKNDHLYLRKAMNKLLPQAIVESLYGGSETLNFFNEGKAIPNLIFLDQHLLKISDRRLIAMIRENEDMKEVPVILLSEDDSFTRADSIKNGANELYNKHYQSKHIDTIVDEIRDKWFVSMLYQKNIS